MVRNMFMKIITSRIQEYKFNVSEFNNNRDRKRCIIGVREQEITKKLLLYSDFV